jgi:hypothetical protein
MHLPAGMEVRPIQILPFMKVPVVSTSAAQRNVIPKNVRTPITCAANTPPPSLCVPGSRGQGLAAGRENSLASAAQRSSKELQRSLQLTARESLQLTAGNRGHKQRFAILPGGALQCGPRTCDQVHVTELVAECTRCMCIDRPRQAACMRQ